MPNRNVHWPVGAVTGAGYATYMANGQCSSHIIAEVAGGVLGGIGGGLLPDYIDAPVSPRHRAEAHSVALTGAAGRYLSSQLPAWQTSLRAQAGHYAQMRSLATSPFAQFLYWLLELACRFTSGVVAGFLAGYASHLVLDALTPSSLPLLG